MNVDLVQLEVIATFHGDPVKDLTREEFEILENGKAQTITHFSLQGDTVPSPAGEPRDAVPTRAAAAVRPEQTLRATAVIVDDIGLSDQSFLSVREALDKAAERLLGPGDLVAVFTTSGRLGALERFTADPRMLRAAIGKLRSAPNHRGSILEGGFSAGCMKEGDREDYYSRLSLAVYRRVVDLLRKLPGYRSILLFSEGMPIIGEPDAPAGRQPARCAWNSSVVNDALLDLYNSFVRHADRSGVAVNTIDPRGLIATFDTAESPSDKGRAGRESALLVSQSQLADIARKTGGVAVTNDNDLSGAVARIRKTEQVYYLIAYKPAQPPAETKDASPPFRRLAVRVRRPGITVRFHSALYENVPRQPAGRPEAAAAAVLSPFTQSDVRLRLASRFWNPGPERKPLLDTILLIDARDLDFRIASDGRRKAVFDLTAVIFGAGPKPVDTVEKGYTVSLTERGYREALDEGLVQRFQLPLSRPGAYQIRAAVLDRETGRMGSAGEFVEIPDVNRGALALSGIVLKRDGGEDAADTALRFHRGEKVDYACQVFNPRPAKSGSVRVRIRPALYFDGKLSGSGEPVLAQSETRPGREPLLSTGDFRLGQHLAPGEYTLLLTAVDENAPEKNARAAQSVDFEVVE